MNHLLWIIPLALYFYMFLKSGNMQVEEEKRISRFFPNGAADSKALDNHIYLNIMDEYEKEKIDKYWENKKVFCNLETIFDRESQGCHQSFYCDTCEKEPWKTSWFECTNKPNLENGHGKILQGKNK